MEFRQDYTLDLPASNHIEQDYLAAKRLWQDVASISCRFNECISKTINSYTYPLPDKIQNHEVLQGCPALQQHIEESFHGDNECAPRSVLENSMSRCQRPSLRAVNGKLFQKFKEASEKINQYDNKENFEALELNPSPQSQKVKQEDSPIRKFTVYKNGSMLLTKLETLLKFMKGPGDQDKIEADLLEKFDLRRPNIE
jgi:hypothetical protein